jgi:hypothetical protein
MKKTDNHNLKAKLDLRRHFLRLAKFDGPISVCDCFSGQEVIWGTLAKEFEVGEYLALDVKEKRGRLKLDSLRYLENQEWSHDVVDLDAYGPPWRHFFQVIQRVASPAGGGRLAGKTILTEITAPKALLVFLTIGETIWKQQQSDALEYCGIPLDVPPAIKGQLGEFILESCLAAPLTAGLIISRAAEARNPGGNARYIGMEIRTKKSLSA